jgi:glycosyltransferase involved in cell wall biosynthesis
VYYKDNPVFLRDALQSVLDNTVQPSECIIVLDGLIPDSLQDVLNHYKKLLPIKLLPLKINVGLGKALSHGILYCQNEWIARFDSDDLCVSDRFEKQLKYIASHPEVSIVGAWISEFENIPEDIYATRRVPELHQAICAYAKKRSPFNHMSVFYKKEIVLAAGNYQDDYLFEDYALWVRMLMLDGTLSANIQESLVNVRAGSAMVGRRSGLKYIWSECKVQKYFYSLGFLNIFEFIHNIVVRFSLRLMPNIAKEFFYRKLLRS